MDNPTTCFHAFPWPHAFLRSHAECRPLTSSNPSISWCSSTPRFPINTMQQSYDNRQLLNLREASKRREGGGGWTKFEQFGGCCCPFPVRFGAGESFSIFICKSGGNSHIWTFPPDLGPIIEGDATFFLGNLVGSAIFVKDFFGGLFVN